MPSNSRAPIRRIDNAIRRHGERIEYIPGDICPCAGTSTRAQIDHALCRGTGHLYHEDKKRVLRALVTGFDPRFHLQIAGIGMPNDLVVSTEIRGVRMQQWDLIRIPGWRGGEPFEGEVIGPIVAGEYDYELAFWPIKLERVFSVDDTSVHEYALGTDYTLDGRTLTFLPGRLPAADDFLTVKYSRMGEYVIAAPPKDRFERGVYLGQQAIVRERWAISPGGTGPRTERPPSFGF